MKRRLFAFALCALFLCGCVAAEPVVVIGTPDLNSEPSASASPVPPVSETPSASEVQWQILPAQTPSTAPTPVLDAAEERGFFEIDIDKNDAYRDFAAEYMYADTAYETVFYRLKDGAYVELGRLDGVLTGNVGYRLPNITLDGMGGVYAAETSILASWAKLHAVYEVQNDALTLKSDGKGIREFNDPPVFLVTNPVTLYLVDYPMWKSFDGTAQEYLTGETVALMPNDTVTFFASDENRVLIGSYETGQSKGYGVLYIDSRDCIENGPFFGDCFYSDRVEWVG